MTSTFKAPFRPAGFFDPIRDNQDNCELDIQTQEYTRAGLHLQPGCMVTVAAFVLPETDSFIVDFMAPQSQVVLHLRAKVSDGVLCMNSMAAGKWQAELKVRGLPLRKGRAFSMSVLVTSKAFMISYNEEHFAAFPHRTPVESVCSWAIYKGLKLGAVYYEVDYKYSPLSFTLMSAEPVEHMKGGCATQCPAVKAANHSAVYPQLPYRMSLEDCGASSGGFFSPGACLIMSLKPDCLSKTLTIAFSQADGKPAMDLQLFVNHSQGRVGFHTESKAVREHSLWSLIGLNRRRHADICICCTDTTLRVFICHRPVFQASREQLKSVWGRVSSLDVSGEADLIVAHFCRV